VTKEGILKRGWTNLTGTLKNVKKKIRKEKPGGGRRKNLLFELLSGFSYGGNMKSRTTNLSLCPCMS
jgi:hypothetical protein